MKKQRGKWEGKIYEEENNEQKSEKGTNTKRGTKA